MYKVTVETSFSSGHYLRNYRGKCENPHGHNYRVLVTLGSKNLDETGLLLDFKELKKLLNPIVEYLDHQMINDLVPFTTLNPSAENLARYFFDQINNRLAALTQSRVKVLEATVFETDTSAATYRNHTNLDVVNL